VAVEEFTEAGALIPSDPICWTGGEEEAQDEVLRREGWRLAWSMEERDGPPERPVSANVYVEAETGDVLVDLMVLGVSSWILCRSRFAFLLWVRDWLGKLAELEQPATARDLREGFEGFLEETTDVLEKLSDWLNASPPGKPGRRSRPPDTEHVWARDPRSSATRST
jgi:hypothetical protein